MTTWRAGQRITASALQEISLGDEQTYTPTVTNGGTVTWTTRTGTYYILGDMVFVKIYLNANAAGSGTSIVTVDMPTSVDRTTRQTLPLHAETVGASGSGSTLSGIIRNGECVFFTGGSGATADRLRVDSNPAGSPSQTGADNIQGVDLKANCLITIQGWYRKA